LALQNDSTGIAAKRLKRQGIAAKRSTPGALPQTDRNARALLQTTKRQGNT
jgi:hypothetical protein